MKPVTTLLSITRLLSVGGCLLLGSCSQGEDALPNGAPGNARLPISVEASLADVVETRTAGYTAVPNAGAIGVFRTAPVTADSPAQYDVKYTYDGTKWSPESEAKQIVVGGENATLCAYYPQGKVSFTTNTTKTALTVKDYTAADDLCYADKPVQAEVNNANRAVSFLMEHAYARLRFHITRNATKLYLGECKVSAIKLEPETTGNDFFTARTLDISLPANDTHQPAPTDAGGWTLDTQTLAMYTTGLQTTAADESIDKLCPPQTFAAGSGTKLTMTVDGNALQVVIPNDKLPGFTAGTIHVIHVEVEGLSIKLLGVTRRQWSAPSDLGEKETH